MVQLEEVRDEEYEKRPLNDDEDWDTDSSSAASADDEDLDDEDVSSLDETLLDRIAALKDIVPPTYRKSLASASETGYAWASRALSLSGKTLWVVSTSALLLGVPWALAFSEEQQVMEMEREMKMQQSANEVGHVPLTSCS